MQFEVTFWKSHFI